MRRWLAALRRIVPLRRRRHWRYVSGHRRRIGWVVFAMLVLVAYGYIHATDHARVRGHVRQYLLRLTGGKVEVADASFSLFGGIQVRGLRVWLPDGVDVTFFEAPQVRLVHNPWTLLLRGRLEPTEIVCVRPKVRLVEDVAEGKLTVLRLFPLAWGREGEPKGLRWLPIIRLRDGELVRIDLEDGQLLPVGRWEQLSIVLQPDQQKQLYMLSFEGPPQASPPIHGDGTIDIATGQTYIEGRAGLQGLDASLPRKYRRWRQQWKLAGKLRWVGDVHVGTLSSADDIGKLEQLTVELENVSMELPPQQGGVRLAGVRGKIVFLDKSIKIEHLAGEIAEAGGASFKLNGEFFGYKHTDPFSINFEIAGLTFPFGEDLFKAWGENVARFHQSLAPAGAVDLTGKLSREATGPKIRATGSAQLRGISLSLPEYPIRVDQVTGKLLFADGALVLSGIAGRHGQAEVRASGTIGGSDEQPIYDITVVAKGLPFNRQIRDGLSESRRRLWDAFSPRGSADFQVHLRRGPGQPSATVLTIDLDGGASIEYHRFPYRLEQVEGRVVMDADGAKIVSIKGRSGPMTCLLSGQIRRRPDGDDVDITIHEVSNLPLDDRLARALPRGARAAFEACRLSGFADVPRAKLTRSPGQPTQFTIPVSIRDATITHRAFPYLIAGAGGELTLTRGKAVIHHLLGRHGKAKVSISGQTLLASGRQLLDLKLEATELALDSELHRALPTTARRWWELLTPAGVADVVLTLQAELNPSGGGAAQTRPAGREDGPPDPPGGRGYRLLVRPRDARILYRHFPYLLRNVNGTVEIVPGKMTLRRVVGTAGDASVTLDGEIFTGPGQERAKLKVSTGPVAIDQRLLSALPEGLVKSLGLVGAGTARLDLDELEFWRGGVETDTAARSKGPTTALAATQPAQPLGWKWTGTITLSGAASRLGPGCKQIVGTIRGTMGCAGPPQTLSAATEVALSDLVIGSRRLGKVSATLVKDSRSPTLKIENLSGRAFGGLVAGAAHVSCAKPSRYAVDLSVQDVSLKQFLAAAGKTPKGALDVEGVLSGKLQMTATGGDAASRRATGKFRITKAKLHKLPVVLGFLNVIYLALPGETAFSSADVEYYLRGHKLVLREIHLRGAALSMLGAGTLNTKTERLKLTFLAGPPRKVPRLDALSEFIGGLTVGLTTVRITGSLGNPKTQSRPFRDVDKTLREIHNPEGP